MSGHFAVNCLDGRSLALPLGAVGARRRELRRAAHIEGERLFAEKPRHLTRRIRRYWDAWHRQRPALALAATAS